MTTKKYIFTLKNIDIDVVDKKYGITICSNIAEVEDNIVPKNVTKISELKTNKPNTDIISFLDETKQIHKCSVSIIDFNTKTEIHLLRYNCYWCRHPFNTQPIGCPIKYVPNIATKQYYSEISKDKYTIKESVTENKIFDTNNSLITLSEKSHYETDGIFCSFNCVMAFILDNRHDKIYDSSKTLLTKMYNDIMEIKSVTISPAPHWRLLQEYGGNMTINDFRNFYKADYECHGIHKEFPEFQSIGILYEEKLKF